MREQHGFRVMKLVPAKSKLGKPRWVPVSALIQIKQAAYDYAELAKKTAPGFEYVVREQ